MRRAERGLVRSRRERGVDQRGPVRAGPPKARFRARSPPLASMAVARRVLRSRPPCAASTSISTAPCSGPAARCCTAPTAGSRSTACGRCRPAARADVEVVLYSGRRQTSVFEDSRLIGSSSYIFELGCGLVVDGELEWLTDGVVPSRAGRDDLRADRAIGGAGAAARALRGPARVPHALVDRPRGLPPVPRRRRSGRGRRRCSTGAGLGLAAARRQRRGPRGVRADGGAAGRSMPIT